MLTVADSENHRRHTAGPSQTKRSYLLCLYIPPPLPKSSALTTAQEPTQHSCTRARQMIARSLACSRLYVPEHESKQHIYHCDITSDCVLRAFASCRWLLRTASSSASTRLALSVRSPEQNKQANMIFWSAYVMYVDAHGCRFRKSQTPYCWSITNQA